MKRRIIALIAAVFLSLLVVAYSGSHRSRREGRELRSASPAEDAAATTATSSSVIPPSLPHPRSPEKHSPVSGSASARPTPSASITLHPPTRAELAEEVRANPHEPPASLLAFAAELAPRMAEARASEAAAQALFPELERCLSDESLQGASSTQAMCLSDARELARKYPSLMPRYRQLTARADRSVQRLSNFVQDGPP